MKRLRGKIDRVLVDAPCTGLGTLRRNPDLKARQDETALAELNAKQRAILASAASLVKPGGRLVYGTCSLLTEENEDIVREFLAAHADFELVPAREVLEHQGVKIPAVGEGDLRSDLLKDLLEAYREAGIEVPYARREVRLIATPETPEKATRSAT